MKIDRQKVYEKYNGRCAYCGRKIEYKDMQVDHIIPKVKYSPLEEIDVDDISNLNPSCRICNHYKRASNLESFREMIAKIPCKLERDSYIYRIGEAYGFYDGNQRNVSFYFEQLEKPKEDT